MRQYSWDRPNGTTRNLGGWCETTEEYERMGMAQGRRAREKMERERFEPIEVSDEDGADE